MIMVKDVWFPRIDKCSGSIHVAKEKYWIRWDMKVLHSEVIATEQNNEKDKKRDLNLSFFGFV